MPHDLPVLDVAHHFASTIDGDRLIIDDPDIDCTEWQVEVWQHEQPDVGGGDLRPFERLTVWGVPGNFLGFGERRTVFAAFVDHLEHAHVLLPNGERLSV